MPESSNDPVIRCFLLKVASRCNINCDYCYMYNHLDQGWKSQPKLMSDETMYQAAQQIYLYAQKYQLDRIAIVYHGGEPLLMPTQKLADHAALLKSLLPDVTVEFSLQTNGILLKDSDIGIFRKAGIQISLSLDGPSTANDKHRLDHQGKSSYANTVAALSLLEKNSDIFSGVIAVIDPENDPQDLLKYFAERKIPQLDFLLPDANFLTLPPGRIEAPNRYADWLVRVFDVWFDQYPMLKIRTFDAILSSLLGVPSETDGFGFGDVSLITIETDGSYHDLDVLKITGEGTSLCTGGVYNKTIEEAVLSEQVDKHRKMLRKEGLCQTCQTCPVVDVCGGGAVPHRYGENGFENTSIYCHELKCLIEHANNRVNEQLAFEIEQQQSRLMTLTYEEIEAYEKVGEGNSILETIFNSFKDNQLSKFQTVLSNIYSFEHETMLIDLSRLKEQELKSLAVLPSVVSWTEVMHKHMVGSEVLDIDKKIIRPDQKYISELLNLTQMTKGWPLVQRDDYFLRAPFADKIYFESAEVANSGIHILEDALMVIRQWKPEILFEMSLISPEIQYIKDPTAHPDKVVSFSDNSVPGALFVQLKRGNTFIDASDLADSIIHEHRHQKLYLLQRVCPIVHADFPLVISPWREELRPPTGLFHALYVFVELLDFWSFNQRREYQKAKAAKECARISEQLKTGFSVVEGCDLTKEGRFILGLLHDRYKKLINEIDPAHTAV